MDVNVNMTNVNTKLISNTNLSVKLIVSLGVNAVMHAAMTMAMTLIMFLKWSVNVCLNRSVNVTMNMNGNVKVYTNAKVIMTVTWDVMDMGMNVYRIAKLNAQVNARRSVKRDVTSNVSVRKNSDTAISAGRNLNIDKISSVYDAESMHLRTLYRASTVNKTKKVNRDFMGKLSTGVNRNKHKK
jgi:hypothetical protein